MGENPPLKANRTLVFMARVSLSMLIMLSSDRICEFVNSNHSLLHMSVPSVSHSWSSTVSSSISDTGRLLDPPHPNKEAVRKLSLLPSDNDKMMTGLWPWLDNAIVYRRAVGKQRA